MFKIIKEPYCEDDSLYLIIEPARYAIDADLIDLKYLEARKEGLRLKDSYPDRFKPFLSKSTLAGFKVPGSIEEITYTATVAIKNGNSYKNLIELMKVLKNTSTKAQLTFGTPANKSALDGLATSGLNTIHYMPGSVKIFFRELNLYDAFIYELLVIKRFFIDPVYGDIMPEIHIISATAQMTHFFTTMANVFVRTDSNNLTNFIYL